MYMCDSTLLLFRFITTTAEAAVFVVAWGKLKADSRRVV